MRKTEPFLEKPWQTTACFHEKSLLVWIYPGTKLFLCFTFTLQGEKDEKVCLDFDLTDFGRKERFLTHTIGFVQRFSIIIVN